MNDLFLEFCDIQPRLWNGLHSFSFGCHLVNALFLRDGHLQGLSPCQIYICWTDTDAFCNYIYWMTCFISPGGFCSLDNWYCCFFSSPINIFLKWPTDEQKPELSLLKFRILQGKKSQCFVQRPLNRQLLAVALWKIFFCFTISPSMDLPMIKCRMLHLSALECLHHA